MHILPIDPEALCFRCRHRELREVSRAALMQKAASIFDSYALDRMLAAFGEQVYYQASCNRSEFDDVGEIMLATTCPLFEADRRTLRHCR